MRRAVLFAAALCVAAPATAQTNYPPSTPQWVDQKTLTLDASGNATWTFDPASPPPIVPVVVHMPAAMDTTNPVTCNYTARTVVLVSIRCWRTSLLGLLTNLYSGSVAGAQVTLVARAIP